MPRPDEDLVRQVFTAYDRGDMDAPHNQYFAPDIRWHFPGGAPWPAITTARPRSRAGSAALADRCA